MAQQSQSFERHTRLSPLYHGFAAPALLAYFFWSASRLFHHPSTETGFGFLLAAALIGLALSARTFALTVQDRVIRLEMRLRMRDLLSADLQRRIPEFTVGQLVALRFAGDEELPVIAAAVLRDKIQDKKTIKKMVKDWQADHQRV
jgi:hypothetical protein